MIKRRHNSLTIFCKNIYPLFNKYNKTKQIKSCNILIYAPCSLIQVTTCRFTSSSTESSDLPFTASPWLLPSIQKTSTWAFICFIVPSKRTWQRQKEKKNRLRIRKSESKITTVEHYHQHLFWKILSWCRNVNNLRYKE